ncbi:hypothetical protein Ntsu_66160 [Nocardia sp. IFM 10818]
MAREVQAGGEGGRVGVGGVGFDHQVADADHEAVGAAGEHFGVSGRACLPGQFGQQGYRLIGRLPGHGVVAQGSGGVASSSPMKSTEEYSRSLVRRW